MSSIRRLWIILAAFFAAYLIYLACTSGHLPEKMATHFGVNGAANRWMPKGEYLCLFAGLGIGLPLFVAVLYCLVTRLPAQLINIPNRQYWLAPERREESVCWLKRQGLWLACGLVLWFGLLHHVMVEVNSMNPPHMSFEFLRLPLIYGACLIVAVTVLTLLRFRKSRGA